MSSKFHLKCMSTLCLLAPLVVILSSHAAAGEKEAGNSCRLPADGKIEGAVTLDANCTYNQSIIITKSHTHLNCNGATLDGESNRKFGVLINSKGQSLTDVVVEQCSIKNFANTGVFVTSGKKPNTWSADHAANYKSSPTNVRLDRLVVDNSGRGGVYLDDYVTESTLSNSTVSGSKRAGIYLDQGSRNNKIINNIIKSNGKSNVSKGRREGLAIDSSAHNLVEGNTFLGNAGGGVFLYKNCGEKFSSGLQPLRWQHSDENIIHDNTFTGEKVGIWVASRQSRDLSKWDCGDPAVDTQGKYFEDFANNNKVENNRFCDSKVGIRVEGDNNKVLNNKFDKKTPVWVDQPYQSRQKPDGRMTTGNEEGGSAGGECTTAIK